MPSIYSFRYISWIAVIASFLGSLMMFIMGGYKTLLAISYFCGFSKWLSTEELSENINLTHLSVATMVSAIDIFLFALVLLIFAYGIYHLFILPSDSIKAKNIPEWAQISKFSELKTILAQVVIIILFVDFLESAVSLGLKWIPWEGIITPLSILLLAAALRLMHAKE